MVDSVYRILGPRHNRLLLVIDSEKRVAGQISHDTAGRLQAAGWTVYDGKAEAKAGWVVPGSDPSLHPRSYKAR